MNEVEPILQGGFIGGGILAAAWAIYSKLKANSASDGAAADRAHAESSLYEKLRAEIDRAAVNESDNRLQMQALKDEITALHERCEKERVESFQMIIKLEKRVDTLTSAVNECQSRHMSRDHEDEQGRQGLIERRRPQTPRGRRNPPKVD